MNRLKVTILVLFITLVTALCLWVYVTNDRMRKLNSIEIARIGKIDFDLTVPVKETLSDRVGYEAIYVLNKSREQYFMLWNRKNGDLLFYYHRLQGGFIAMSATYEITDPNKKNVLLEFVKKYFSEPQ